MNDAHTALERAIIALETEKVRRILAATKLPDLAIRASANALDLDVCQVQVTTLDKRRASAIAAARPDDVIAIDELLLKARIAVEIAAGRSESSTEKHAAAVIELRQAEKAVMDAAVAQINEETNVMALKFLADLDTVLGKGAEVEALSHREGSLMALGSTPPLPAAVVRALERLPKPNWRDVPLNELRGGGTSAIWSRRLQELTAADESVAA